VGGPGRQGLVTTLRRAPANSLPVFQQPGRAAAVQLTTSLQTLFTAGRSPPNYQMDRTTGCSARPERFADGRGQLVGFWIWETADESFG
jgi:hypothetical protein